MPGAAQLEVQQAAEALGTVPTWVTLSDCIEPSRLWASWCPPPCTCSAPRRWRRWRSSRPRRLSARSRPVTLSDSLVGALVPAALHLPGGAPLAVQQAEEALGTAPTWITHSDCLVGAGRPGAHRPAPARRRTHSSAGSNEIFLKVPDCLTLHTGIIQV